MTDDAVPDPVADPTPPGGGPGATAVPTPDPAPATTPSTAPPAVAGLAKDERGLVRVAAGFYGVVGLFAVGYALFSGNLNGLLGTRVPTAGGVLGALGVAVLLVAVSRVGEKAWRPMREAAAALEGILGPLGWRSALLLALLSGVAEELLFRGALWPHLGLFGTALLFGLVHVLPHRALWVYPLFAAAAGLLLGLLRAGTDSVVPPMLAHVLVNAANLAWLGARARTRRPPAAPAT